MMMFSLFCLVEIFRFFIGNRYQSLPEAKQDIDDEVISLREAKDDIKVLWSELDSNILGEIICRLTSPTDQARFHAVCQTWLAVEPVGIRTAAPALLPWFVGHNRSVSCFTGTLELLLYEASPTLHPTSVHKISLTKLGIPSPSSWIDNMVVACVNNWLFFCTRLPMFSCYRRNFILVSPFTKKVIKLPQSDYPLPFTFSRTFSTDPESPDCVFLLSDTKCLDDSSKIAILTYRNGDKEWTARRFNRVDQFVPCECIPIYFQGVFYLVTAFGQIASYNILNCEFRFENLVIEHHFELNYNSCLQFDVFEFNGYLTLIYYGSLLETNNKNFPGNPCMKRFDWSNNVWIPVRCLGDETLFVGRQFRSVARFKARHNEVLPNKIYYFSPSGCMIYSLKNGALVEHEFLSSNFTNSNTTNYYLASGGDFQGSSWLEHLLGRGAHHFWMNNFIWLKPPIVGNRLLR